MKRTLTLLVALATFMAIGASGALAGEINGQGQRPMVVGTTPEGGQILHARSECAFSGLNDEYVLDLPSDGFGRTQNWGQIPKGERDLQKG